MTKMWKHQGDIKYNKIIENCTDNKKWKWFESLYLHNPALLQALSYDSINTQAWHIQNLYQTIVKGPKSRQLQGGEKCYLEAEGMYKPEL